MVEIENVVARLAEAVEHRFFGKYRGFVVDNEDPEDLGRLTARIPSLLGEDIVTGWAMPCVPYGGNAGRGLLFVPERDAGVWVEFEEGDLEFPVWVGTFWSAPNNQSEVPRPNDADGAEAGDIQSPPTRKIIKTATGHTIQFEDADDEVRIIIADGQTENRIVLGPGGLTVVNKGNEILMTDEGIVIGDGNGNSVTQDGSGIVIEDNNGNTITMDAVSGGIPGTPGVAVNGGKKVCLEGLITWLMSHTHIGNMGAPCPVNPGQLADLVTALALPDGDILSAKVTLG